MTPPPPLGRIVVTILALISSLFDILFIDWSRGTFYYVICPAI